MCADVRRLCRARALPPPQRSPCRLQLTPCPRNPAAASSTARAKTGAPGRLRGARPAIQASLAKGLGTLGEPRMWERIVQAPRRSGRLTWSGDSGHLVSEEENRMMSRLYRRQGHCGFNAIQCLVSCIQWTFKVTHLAQVSSLGPLLTSRCTLLSWLCPRPTCAPKQIACSFCLGSVSVVPCSLYDMGSTGKAQVEAESKQT